MWSTHHRSPIRKFRTLETQSSQPANNDFQRPADPELKVSADWNESGDLWVIVRIIIALTIR